MRYGEFVLVDGFSGPWRSHGGKFDDTSFMIAVEQLRRVQNIVRQKHPNFGVRCLFIEKDPLAFEGLKGAIGDQSYIAAETLNGEFESHIETIKKFAGKSFLFLFVDPTGWQGFALKRMFPLMRLRGEILINFMFDHINRFLEHDSQEIAQQMDELMGSSEWRSLFSARLDAGMGREDAILETYKEQLKKVGGYKFVSSIRIMKPNSERSYFHLVYGTQALPGIQAFSRVEKKAAEEQRLVRSKVSERTNLEKSAQMPMFSLDEMPLRQSWFDVERASAIARARRLFERRLRAQTRLEYDNLLGPMIELSLVWESDVKSIIAEFEKEGAVQIIGKNANQRVPKSGNIIEWIGS